MQRVLILFATREGQTKKIATQISKHLKDSGRQVDLVDARNARAAARLDLDHYGLLVFGGSLHAGGLEGELIRFINRHAEQIKLKPSYFFLVLLSAATKQPTLRATSLADAQRKIDEQLTVKFNDTEMIAGALLYSKYPRPLKWLMRSIAKKAGEDTNTAKDYEYTDWPQVEQYARRLAKR